eukprot:gene1185-18062_t
MQQVGKGLVDIETDGAEEEEEPAPAGGIKEVEVLSWDVSEGDEVEGGEFQKLCDVQSDKATVEITSKYAGKLSKIYTPAGKAWLLFMQQVGQPLRLLPPPPRPPRPPPPPKRRRLAPPLPLPAASNTQRPRLRDKVLASPMIRSKARAAGAGARLRWGSRTHRR